MAKFALAALLLAGCASHANDPKTCRERTVRAVGNVYPDPDNLEKVLVAVCGDQP